MGLQGNLDLSEIAVDDSFLEGPSLAAGERTRHVSNTTWETFDLIIIAETELSAKYIPRSRAHKGI